MKKRNICLTVVTICLIIAISFYGFQTYQHLDSKIPRYNFMLCLIALFIGIAFIGGSYVVFWLDQYYKELQLEPVRRLPDLIRYVSIVKPIKRIVKPIQYWSCEYCHMTNDITDKLCYYCNAPRIFNYETP